MKQVNVINQNIDSHYLDLFCSLYGKEKNIDYFVSDISLSINYCLSTKYLSTMTFTEDSVLLGHCSIIKTSQNNNEFAYFGFFETTENKEHFQLLWTGVIKEAKKQNIKKLLGPINGSIWFPYRFIHISDGSPFFKGELPTKLSYHKLFRDLNYSKITTFSSGMRNNFDFIIEATKNSYGCMESQGFTIGVLLEVTDKILKEIQTFAKAVFIGQSIAYEDFPTDYFLKLYNQDKTNDLFGLYMVRKNRELVGFCSIFYENDKTLIFKTFAVHPLFQRNGIGSAIAHLVHRDAKNLGIEKIIYALVRDGNNIKFFPKDDVPNIRTYSIFEFNV
jgi:GNAT superfamily N-acetyltransferase